MTSRRAWETFSTVLATLCIYNLRKMWRGMVRMLQCTVLCCMVLLTFITLIFCQLSTICIYYLFLLDLLLSANSLTTFVVRELSWVCFPSPALTDWTAFSMTLGRGPSTSSNQHGNVVSLSSSLVWVVWEVEMWETSLCCFTEEW